MKNLNMPVFQKSAKPLNVLVRGSSKPHAVQDKYDANCERRVTINTINTTSSEMLSVIQIFGYIDRTPVLVPLHRRYAPFILSYFLTTFYTGEGGMSEATS